MLKVKVRHWCKANVGTMDTLGKRIRILMIERGLNQTDLLRILREDGIKIGKSNLSKIVTDNAVMFSPDLLEAIGKALDVNLHYLLTGVEVDGKEERFGNVEAERVGAIVDKLDIGQRKFVLLVVEKIATLDAEHREFVISVIDKVLEMDKHRRSLAGELFEVRKDRASVQEDFERA